MPTNFHRLVRSAANSANFGVNCHTPAPWRDRIGMLTCHNFGCRVSNRIQACSIFVAAAPMSGNADRAPRKTSLLCAPAGKSGLFACKLVESDLAQARHCSVHPECSPDSPPPHDPPSTSSQIAQHRPGSNSRSIETLRSAEFGWIWLIRANTGPDSTSIPPVLNARGPILANISHSRSKAIGRCVGIARRSFLGMIARIS